MAKQYTATRPVGRFKKGDVVGGLSDAQIKKLLTDGTIQEAREIKIAAPAKKTTGDEK